MKKNEMIIAFGMYGILAGKPGGICRNYTGKGNHGPSDIVIINHSCDPCETVCIVVHRNWQVRVDACAVQQVLMYAIGQSRYENFWVKGKDANTREGTSVVHRYINCPK